MAKSICKGKDDSFIIIIDNVANVGKTDDQNSWNIRFVFKHGDTISISWKYNSEKDRNKAWDMIKPHFECVEIEVNTISL